MMADATVHGLAALGTDWMLTGLPTTAALLLLLLLLPPAKRKRNEILDLDVQAGV